MTPKAEREEVISALVNDFLKALDLDKADSLQMENHRLEELTKLSNKGLEIEWLLCMHEKIIVV
jgi:DNA polymerase III psi subunit